MLSEALRIYTEHTGEDAGRLRPGDVRDHGRSRHDPLLDARRRVRAGRRVSARLPTGGELAEARQNDETALPEDSD